MNIFYHIKDALSTYGEVQETTSSWSFDDFVPLEVPLEKIFQHLHHKHNQILTVNEMESI